MAIQLGTAALGAGMSFFQGKQMEADAQNKINNFKWKEQTNPFKNQSVSTMGSDLIKEQNNAATATSVEALRGSGTRGVMGGVPSVIENTNDVNRRVAADLDEQQKVIDGNIAKRDIDIQNIEERRQGEELSGYANALNVGMGMKHQGITQGVNALGAASAMYGAAKSEGDVGWQAILGFGKTKDKI